MPETTLSLAKTTQPTLAMVLDRERLFEKIEAEAAAKAVWITGPPGSGKSTLIASYIQVRKLTALWYQLDCADAEVSTFFYYLRQSAIKHSKTSDQKIPETKGVIGDWDQLAHRTFRAIFSRFDGPLTIVFDNHETIPLNSDLHSVLAAAIEEIPAGSRLIIISRSSPGPEMARFRATKIMTLIDGEDLKLNEEESKSLARIRDPGIKLDTIEKVQELTAGWMTGTILMYEYAKQSDKLGQSIHGKTGEILFDYVAEEVFNTFDEEVRNFLLSVCWPRRLSIGLADSISMQSIARQLLANLARNNYFITERYDSLNIEYIIHPLLREYLQNRVNKTFRQSAIMDIKRRTVEALIKEGQIEETVELLVDIFDWDKLETVIEEHAALLLNQGRSSLLVNWLEELPDDRLKDNPWLLCWYGKARLEQAPREARRYYELALNSFKTDSDETRNDSLAACIGIIESIIIEADDYILLDIWIPRLEQLIGIRTQKHENHDSNHAVIIILIALMLRNPAHQNTDEWFIKANLEFREIRDDNIRYIQGKWLVLAQLLAGKLDEAESILEILQFRATQSDQITHLCQCQLLLALLQILRGKVAAAVITADRCLEIAESQCLQNILPLTYACRTVITLIQNDTAAANHYLKKVTQLPTGNRRLIQLLNNYLSSWLALITNEKIKALHAQRQALNYASELGMPFFEVLSRTAYAQLLFLCEDNRSGTAQLRRVHSIARDVRNPLLEFMTLLVYGDVAMRGGKTTSGTNALRYALGLARKHAFYHLLWWHPRDLGNVCATALRYDIETDFVRDLIKRTNLQPGVAPLDIAEWPWPLQIRAMGGLNIIVNDNEINSAGKSQARPLQLFKVLIALGGKGIRAQQVAQTLWPHVDEEYGIKSLTINLHRLRRLLGHDEALLLQDGLLSINDKLVWLDVWALDQMYLKIEKSQYQTGILSSDGEMLEWFDRLLTYYQGPFLGTEEQPACVMASRDFHRSRYVKAVEILATGIAERNDPDTINALYERAIERDPGVEELYHRLMIRLYKQGDPAHAMDIYTRCQESLSRTHQHIPSPEMQGLFEKLRNDTNKIVTGH